MTQHVPRPLPNAQISGRLATRVSMSMLVFVLAQSCHNPARTASVSQPSGGDLAPTDNRLVERASRLEKALETGTWTPPFMQERLRTPLGFDLRARVAAWAGSAGVVDRESPKDEDGDGIVERKVGYSGGLPVREECDVDLDGQMDVALFALRGGGYYFVTRLGDESSLHGGWSRKDTRLPPPRWGIVTEVLPLSGRFNARINKGDGPHPGDRFIVIDNERLAEGRGQHGICIVSVLEASGRSVSFRLPSSSVAQVRPGMIIWNREWF